MFGIVANDYFEKNLTVIPLRGKVPITKNWQRYCTEHIKEDVLVSWEKGFKNANVGLPLGPSNNLIALDIDSDDPKVLKAAPLSPVVKRGKKGETRFFRYNGEASRKRHDLFYEILSLGNQTVIPPSIHPETKTAYTWTGMGDLLSADIDELPILDGEFVKMLEDNRPSGGVEITPSDGSRCNHGSHTKLSAMLVAKIKDYETPETIVKELLEYDEKINPVVSYFICPSRKWRSKSRELNAYQFVLQDYEKHQKISLSSIEIKPVEKPKEKRVMLPHLRGIGKEIFDYVYRTSYVKRSRFAFASSVSAIGTLASNKFHFNNTYSNLYSLIVSPSGGGKDRPQEFLSDLFYHTNLTNLVGIGVPQSPQAVVKPLPNFRERIDLIDEANGFFKNIGKQNHHQAGIANIYAELFTRAGKFYGGMSALKHGDTPLGQCYSPCISILAAMTVRGFRNAFNTSLVDEGLGGRFMYFIDDRYKEAEIFIDVEDIPKDILTFARICRLKRYDEVDTSNDPHPTMIDFKNKWAKDAYKDIYSSIEKEKRGQYEDNSKIMALTSRSVENIKKLALIDCISTQLLDDDENMAITKDNLDWAYKVDCAHREVVEKFFDENLHDSLNERIKETIVSILKNHSQTVMGKRELTRKLSSSSGLRSISAFHWNEQLKSLEESGIISITQEKTKGKSKFFLSLL
jgi:hypothetical protein